MRARTCLMALAGGLALAGCAQSQMPPLTGPVPTGGGTQSALESRAGEPLVFKVKRYPSGEPYDLASDRGSVVLLDVWATWCEPCRDALPFYENLAREYAGRGLKVYALSVDEDPRAIAPFLEETKVGLPVLLDENAQVAERTLKVKGMPTTFYIDRRGVVRHFEEGFAEEFLTRYQSHIEALLAEPAP
ncbi:TlpA family protein disulfide reductase [Pyxidicoccus parkwayensis]|uniref:TlpA family protein disulfide reductase n=1 Tax=Pyxidicoccus parkwayensis TaxID=2813578 RepID=A0ABX7NPD6_9BACT|nr:TlpA disulfide reductase family protein [Pyxidicoccus parkwaysis]QSQ19420.1 TlpA family protein disulfide reductase [Pyxidicoccus parkwaysis]